MPIEVPWDQLAVEGQVEHYKEAWPEIFFKPVIEGLRQIGRDEMGGAISFVSGALVIDHELSNIGDTKDRTKYIVEIVEKGL